MTDWADVISKIGFPCAFSVMMGVAIWRVVTWGRPYAEQLVKAHLSLVTALNERDEKQTTHLGSIDSRLKTVETEVVRTREMATAHMDVCQLVHRTKVTAQ